MDITEMVQNRLFELQDTEYKEFQCKLMPTVATETVIGVRTPQLRSLAKELSKQPEIWQFMKILPHRYYEENNLHGFLIENIKDYNEAVDAVEEFLPYVDNWATCDLMSPKVFKKHLPELEVEIKRWLSSRHTYTIRFGIEMLMSHYLDENFSPEYPELVAEVKSEEYYVNMMIAWYFATALAKRYDEILPYIEQRRLDRWTHNKTIQKAVESFRITDEQKTCLKALKIK
ncbi:MAG: DNA alkylation repair protein [Clostridia bacterium]|nr:DNA alkylation repair protein [Clostridia bacterium]